MRLSVIRLKNGPADIVMTSADPDESVRTPRGTHASHGTPRVRCIATATSRDGRALPRLSLDNCDRLTPTMTAASSSERFRSEIDFSSVSMLRNVHNVHISVNAQCARHGVAVQGKSVHNVHIMHKKHYLREWRDYRGYSLERVASELEVLSHLPEFLRPDKKRPVGTTNQNLGKIERGVVPYSQALIEMLARIYGTDPGSLLMRNPLDRDAIYSIWDNIPAAKREIALQMLTGLMERKDGTNG